MPLTHTPTHPFKYHALFPLTTIKIPIRTNNLSSASQPARFIRPSLDFIMQTILPNRRHIVSLPACCIRLAAAKLILPRLL